jgi:hypothetical protein
MTYFPQGTLVYVRGFRRTFGYVLEVPDPQNNLNLYLLRTLRIGDCYVFFTRVARALWTFLGPVVCRPFTR